MEDEDPTYNKEEIKDFLKAYWKRQKQEQLFRDQATRLLEGREKKESNLRRGSLIEEAKTKSSKDDAKKKLPGSGRSNLKYFKKSSKYYGGRQGSPWTAHPFYPKSRSHSSNSSSSESHESARFHYAKPFDLRSILPQKSSIQQDAERYRNNKSYKSQALERSSSAEVEDGYQISKSKPRAQKGSSNRYSRCSCCRNCDSFNSSESESYHPSSHRSHSSRHQLHRRSSPSPYPDRKKSTKHCHGSRRSKRSTSNRPIDMANEPPVQSDSFSRCNHHSHSDRSYGLKRESYFAQNYASHHKGHKRYRSPSFEQWSWRRSPVRGNVHEKRVEDSAREVNRQKTCLTKKPKFPGNDILRSPTLEGGSSSRYSGKKVAPRETSLGKESNDKLNKAECSYFKDGNKRMHEKFVKSIKVKEIEKWIMSNEESNSSTRNPRVVSREMIVAIENDPVWQTKSQDVVSQESGVLTEMDKTRQTESQKLTSKESKVSMEKDSIAVTSNETEQFVECKNPKVTFEESEVSNKNDHILESEAPDVTFVEERKVARESIQWVESEALDVIFVESRIQNGKDLCEVSKSPKLTFVEETRATNEDQCQESEAPEVTFVEERSVTKESIESEARVVTFVESGVQNGKDLCDVSKSPKLTFVEETRATNEDQCQESEAPDVTFAEERSVTKESLESEAQEVVFVESRVQNGKELCEVSKAPKLTFVEETRATYEDQCQESEAPDVTFVEERSVTKKNIHRVESEAREVIFVESGVQNCKDVCEVSKALKLTFVKEKGAANEDQCKKSQAPEDTFVEKRRVAKENGRRGESEVPEITSKRSRVSNTVSLPKDHAAIQNDFQERKKIVPNTFFCDVCQLQLSSEVTWSIHMVGKKHTRKVQLRSVYEIAKASLPVLKPPPISTDDVPQFANPPGNKKRQFTRYIARLQHTIDEMREPVPGLEYVHEIISPMGIEYCCTLCGVLCRRADIVPHLFGFRHQLGVVRELFPGYYHLNEDQQDRNEIRYLLWKYEKKYGRGLIKVFREVEDRNTRSAYNQPGPSYRYPTLPYNKKEQQEEDPTNLYIANLPCFMTEIELENMLRPYGNVISTRILRDPSMNSLGIGLARMDNRYMCEMIIQRFNGEVLPGARMALLVKFADLFNKRRSQFKSETPRL